MTDRASTLQPTRPLVWIGVETTGTGPAKSRIAKIAILRIEPTGVTTNYIRRLNPGKVAGLTSSSLRRYRRGSAKCPTFADIQGRIYGLLRGCDLIGYNLKCFTIPFLAAEFERAGARMCFRDCNLIEM